MRDARVLIRKRRDGKAVPRPFELCEVLRQVFAVQRVGPQQKTRQRVRFAQLLSRSRSDAETT